MPSWPSPPLLRDSDASSSRKGGRSRGGRGRPARWIGAIGLAAAFLFPVAAPAAAQVEVERLRDLFPADAMSQIETIADRAERDGIPRRLMMDKALEGAAKGASSEQVLNTLSGYLRELRAARQVVGAPASPDVLVAAADALRRGVDRSDVRALGRDRPGELAIVLVVMGDLTQEGVPSGQARGLVEAARAGGWRGDRLLTLSAAVRRLVREGATPSEAAETVRQELRGGGPPR